MCRLETQDRSSLIDLATGQINGQQETAVPQSTSSSVEMNTNCQQVVTKKLKPQDFSQHAASERQMPIFPLARSHEHVSSVSTTPRHNPNIAKSLTFDSSSIQAPKLWKERNNYDKLVREKETKKQIAKETEPNYEDLATLEQTMHSQQIITNKSEQEQKNIKGISESNHEYEELTKVTDDSKIPNTPTHGRYNVLTTATDINPFQDAIVQEDTAENINEDKYYSITRVHRLVPVGKPINQRNNDALYQALEEPVSQSNYSCNQVQPRHNTFASWTTNPKGGAEDNLVRSYSHSLEKLDPMYDEPFKEEQRSTPQLDIYNVDSLFDDPKYVSKDHTDRTFSTECPVRGASLTAHSPGKQESKAAMRKTK